MRKAMILAAGKGTRLRPFTDSMPKALFPVNGIPLLEIIINKLINYQFYSIIINVHHFADKIEDFLKKNNNFGIQIELSREVNLLETGGALKQASWFFKDSPYFIIHNVDIISDLDFNEIYESAMISHSLATLAVSERTSSRFLLFDEKMNLKGWRNTITHEEKIYSNDLLKPYAFSGIQVSSSEIFQYFPDENYFSLTSFYLSLCQSNRIKGFVHSSLNWQDIGKFNKLN